VTSVLVQEAKDLLPGSERVDAYPSGRRARIGSNHAFQFELGCGASSHLSGSSQSHCLRRALLENIQSMFLAWPSAA